MVEKPFETITISIGKKCAQSCNFCYHGASENGYFFNEELDKLESFFSKLKNTPKKIILAGNDPLLYASTSARIISFLKHTYNKIDIEILTNLLSLDFLLEKYVYMEENDVVNLDYKTVLSVGFAVTIDNRKNLPDYWLREELISRLNIENAMFTFSSSTEDTTPEFIIGWAKLLHTDVIRINLDFSSKNKIKDPHLLVNKVINLIKYGIKNNIYILGDWDAILTNMIDNKSGNYCGGGDTYLTASEMLACTYIKDIKQNEFMENTNQTNDAYKKLKEAMESYRKQLVKKRGCDTCKLEKWCGGGCLAVDANLFCNFMRDMVEMFENDKEFREIYLPKEIKEIK